MLQFCKVTKEENIKRELGNKIKTELLFLTGNLISQNNIEKIAVIKCMKTQTCTDMCQVEETDHTLWNSSLVPAAWSSLGIWILNLGFNR